MPAAAKTDREVIIGRVQWRVLLAGVFLVHIILLFYYLTQTLLRLQVPSQNVRLSKTVFGNWKKTIRSHDLSAHEYCIIILWLYLRSSGCAVTNGYKSNLYAPLPPSPGALSENSFSFPYVMRVARVSATIDHYRYRYVVFPSGRLEIIIVIIPLRLALSPDFR